MTAAASTTRSAIWQEWWNAEDVARYKERAAKVAQQYSGYAPLPGQTINGQQTLGENISDLGGVKLAYDGLQRALAAQPDEQIDDYTPEQRFFLSFATIWRTKYRTEALIDQLRTGQSFAGALSGARSARQRAGSSRRLQLSSRCADDARGKRSRSQSGELR